MLHAWISPTDNAASARKYPKAPSQDINPTSFLREKKNTKSFAKIKTIGTMREDLTWIPAKFFSSQTQSLHLRVSVWRYVCISGPSWGSTLCLPLRFLRGRNGTSVLCTYLLLRRTGEELQNQLSREISTPTGMQVTFMLNKIGHLPNLFILPWLFIWHYIGAVTQGVALYLVWYHPCFASNSVNNLCHCSMSHFQMEDKTLFLLQCKILTANVRRCSDSYLNYMPDSLH